MCGMSDLNPWCGERQPDFNLELCGPPVTALPTRPRVHPYPNVLNARGPAPCAQCRYPDCSCFRGWCSASSLAGSGGIAGATTKPTLRGWNPGKRCYAISGFRVTRSPRRFAAAVTCPMGLLWAICPVNRIVPKAATGGRSLSGQW